MTTGIEQARSLAHALADELAATRPADRCGQPMHGDPAALTCGRHRDHATTGIVARESHATWDTAVNADGHIAETSLVTWLDTP